MKRKELFLTSIFFLVVTAVFFYKTVLLSHVPFPGDLLVAEYNPWKGYSYLGYVPGSFPNKAQYFDTIRQIYPWKTLSTSLIKNLKLPLWNPYNFSGSPLLANSQSAVFYPLNIFYFFLPQHIAWTLLVILQPFLAAIFTYVYAREIGISKKGSILSGLSFSFSLFMSVFLEYSNIGHTFLWLPLILFLVERNLKKRSFLNSFLFMATVAISFFAGHLQIWGFLWVFTSIYIFFRIYLNTSLNKHYNFIFFLILIFLGIGISAINLFPTLELINQSARVSQSYTFLINNLLIQPNQLILFLSPDFFGNPATRNYLLQDSYPGNALYVGFIPFVLALYAVVKGRGKYFVKFYLVASVILLALFLRTPFTEFLYSHNVPIISTGSPTNAIFLLSFFLSVLAGYGTEYFEKSPFRKDVIIEVLVGSFLLLNLILAVFSHTAFNKNNFIYSVFLLGLLIAISFFKKIFKKNTIFVSSLLVLITVLDLFYFFQKFNPFVSSKLIYPSTKITDFLKSKKSIDRFWGYGSGSVDANIATGYSLFSPDGYDPLYPKRYGEFIYLSKNWHLGKTFDNSNRSDAIIAPGYGNKDFLLNKSRQKVLNILGVKYILDRDEAPSLEKFPSDSFTKVYNSDGWQVYENKRVVPRVTLFSDFKVFKTNQEFENVFSSNDFDPSKTVLLEEKPADLQFKSVVKGNAEIETYSPNSVVIKTFTSGNNLLFLSDTFYPGWKAYVDNKETPIIRANYTFRSVVVPSGLHTVVFKYEPYSFSYGLKTSIISLVGGIVLLLVITRKRLI